MEDLSPNSRRISYDRYGDSKGLIKKYVNKKYLLCSIRYIYIYIYIYIYSPFVRAHRDTRSLLKRNLTSLNSEFFFFLAGHHTKFLRASLTYYLSITEEKITVFTYFPGYQHYRKWGQYRPNLNTTGASTHTHTHIYMYVCVCVCVCVRERGSKCMSVCVCVWCSVSQYILDPRNW